MVKDFNIFHRLDYTCTSFFKATFFLIKLLSIGCDDHESEKRTLNKIPDPSVNIVLVGKGGP